MGGLENYAAWWDWKWVLKGREGSKPQTPVCVAGLLWMWGLHVQGRVYSGGVQEATQDCSSGSTSVSLHVMWARWGALGGTLWGLHKSERLGASGCLTVRQDTWHRNWKLGICCKITRVGGEGSRAEIRVAASSWLFEQDEGPSGVQWTFLSAFLYLWNIPKFKRCLKQFCFDGRKCSGRTFIPEATHCVYSTVKEGDVFWGAAFWGFGLWAASWV